MTNQALRLTLAIVAFAVLGWLLVTVAAGDAASKPFRDASRSLVWQVLMAAQVASWPILWRVGRDRLNVLAGYGAGDRRVAERVRLAGLAAVLLVLWLPPQLDGEAAFPALPHHGLRVGVALFGGFTAVAPCLLAIWRTHEALAPDVVDRASAVAVLERLNVLRGVLTSALTAVGVLVTLATLTTGALRSALIQAHPAVADDFPPEYVLLYGTSFTVLLAAAAAPTFGRMRRRSTAVVDELLPVLAPPEKGWRERLAERRDLAAYLGADTNVLQGVQAAVLVAGPLLSGLFSALLPTRA